MAGSHEFFATLTSSIGNLLHHSPDRPIAKPPLPIESGNGIPNIVAPDFGDLESKVTDGLGKNNAEGYTTSDYAYQGNRNDPCGGFDFGTAACKIVSACHAAKKRNTTNSDTITVYLCPFSGLRNGDNNAKPNTYAGYTCIMPLDTIVDLGEKLPGKHIDGVRDSIKRMTRDLKGARQATIADSIYRNKAHLFKRISIEIDTDT